MNREVYYKKLGLKNDDEIFEYLTTKVRESIKGWDYFVNWEKAISNTRELEIQLNMLNYLIGKEDIKGALKELLEQYPEVLKVVPFVIASREKEFKIMEIINDKIITQDFNFSRKIKKGENLTTEEIDNAVKFLEKVGFLELIKNKTIKNVVDYALGLEVGLDTNGRKNRTGTAMENLVEIFIKNMCEANGWEYTNQGTVAEIYRLWNIEVPSDKSKRRYDFVVNNNGKLLMIEVNYYNGGGSKLKSVANEFTKLNKYIVDEGFTFCWITDGIGWETSLRPLRDAFDKVDYIFNLDMVQKGVLEELIKNHLNQSLDSKEIIDSKKMNLFK